MGFRSWSLYVLLTAAFGLLGVAATAQSPCVSIARAIDGCSAPGREITVTVTVSSTCEESLTAVGLRETIPAGWSFQGVSDASDDPPALASNLGTFGTLEFAWVDVPSFPATFAYVLQVSAAENGAQDLSGAPVYRESGGEVTGASVVTTVCFSSSGGTAGTPVIQLIGEPSQMLSCGDLYEEEGATATDPQDGDLTAQIVRSGFVNTQSAGIYVVTYNVVDSDGNQAQQVARQIVVTDTLPPEVMLNGAASLTHACGTPYIEFGATATDVCDGTLPVFITGAVDVSEPGDYTLTYTATDATGRIATASRVVTVADMSGPLITLAGESPMTVACNAPYVEPGATAVDACDGLEASVTIQNNTIDTSTLGTHTVLYRATDSSGFESAATREVIVADMEAPVITVLGDDPVFLDCGQTFIDPNAMAIDACDGEVRVSSDAVSLVDTSKPNTVEITYSARDARGNAAFASRTVIVGGSVCGGGLLYCGLSDLSITQPRVLDDMATVVVPEGSTARRVLFSSAVTQESFQDCETGTVRVSYDVSGSVQTSQSAGDGYPVVYFLREGQHTIKVTAEVLESGATLEQSFTLDMPAAPDSDANGYVDQPFSALIADGDNWTNDPEFQGRDGKITMSTWFGPCTSSATEPLTVRVRNPENNMQLLTVSVDRALLDCDEQGILVVSLGSRLEHILGVDGVAAVPTVPAGFPSNGVFFDISIVTSSDGGATVTPISDDRLAEHPVRITLTGQTIADAATSGLFHYPTAASSNGDMFSITAGSGSWTATSAQDVTVSGTTITGEVTSLSLFASNAGDTGDVDKAAGASCAPRSHAAGGLPYSDLMIVALVLGVLLVFGRGQIART